MHIACASYVCLINLGNIECCNKLFWFLVHSVRFVKRTKNVWPLVRVTYFIKVARVRTGNINSVLVSLLRVFVTQFVEWCSTNIMLYKCIQMYLRCFPIPFTIQLCYDTVAYILNDRSVTIHIPCDSIQFWVLPFDYDYFDSIM